MPHHFPVARFSMGHGNVTIFLSISSFPQTNPISLSGTKEQRRQSPSSQPQWTRLEDADLNPVCQLGQLAEMQRTGTRALEFPKRLPCSLLVEMKASLWEKRSRQRMPTRSVVHQRGLQKLHNDNKVATFEKNVKHCRHHTKLPQFLFQCLFEEGSI